MDYPDPPFALSEAERAHPLWLKLKAHCERRLNAKLEQLASDLSEPQTASIRGHIRCLKELIALDLEPPQL
jgi:hypothetical protein